MGLYARILGTEDTSIPAHDWPKAFQFWRRGRLTLEDDVTNGGLLDMWLDAAGTPDTLIDKSETISTVATGTNKLGLSVSHTWADDDGVFVTSTGTLPAPLSADTLYYVVSSNPGQGTVKLSSIKGGAEIDITTEGTGTRTLKRFDPDVVHYHETRLSVTSTDGNADQKLRRRVWDEDAEGIFELATSDRAYRTVALMKTELEDSATHLSR